MRSYLQLGDYSCSFSLANSFFSSRGPNTNTLFAVVRPWTRADPPHENCIASARVSKDCEANKPNAARRVVLRRTKRGLVAYMLTQNSKQARTVRNPPPPLSPLTICLGYRDLYRSYPAPGPRRPGPLILPSGPTRTTEILARKKRGVTRERKPEGKVPQG